MKVEKDIPIPNAKRRIYPSIPWDKLNKGDSIFLNVKFSSSEDKNRFRTAMYARASYYKKKIRLSEREEKGKKGYRLWIVQ